MLHVQDTHHHHDRLADYTRVIGVGIQFAFQPLVHLGLSRVIGYEALVRGRSGEPAASIIANVRPENLGYFDQACRTRAIHDAQKVGLRNDLFLNCTELTPQDIDLAVRTTTEQSVAAGIGPESIVLEFASLKKLGSPRELASVREQAQAAGFRVLSDNFGAGEAGLKRLAVFRPDYVKLDRELIAQVHRSRTRQAVVMGIVSTCRALGIEVIAAGVERWEDVVWLRENAGIECFQGYYFARPELNQKPLVDQQLLG